MFFFCPVKLWQLRILDCISPNGFEIDVSQNLKKFNERIFSFQNIFLLQPIAKEDITNNNRETRVFS